VPVEAAHQLTRVTNRLESATPMPGRSVETTSPLPHFGAQQPSVRYGQDQRSARCCASHRICDIPRQPEVSTRTEAASVALR
jgi:hypothetical protein